MFDNMLDQDKDKDVKKALMLLLVIAASVLTTSWLLSPPTSFGLELVAQIAPLLITISTLYAIYRFPHNYLIKSYVAVIYILSFSCWSFAIYLDASSQSIAAGTKTDLMTGQLTGISQGIYWLGLFALNLIVNRYLKFALYLSGALTLSLVAILFIFTPLSTVYVIALFILLSTATAMSILGFSRTDIQSEPSIALTDFEDFDLEPVNEPEQIPDKLPFVEQKDERQWAPVLINLQTELSNTTDLEQLFKRMLGYLSSNMPYNAAAVGMTKDKALRKIAVLGDQSYLQSNVLDWNSTRLKGIFSSREAISSKQGTNINRLDIPVISNQKPAGIITLFRNSVEFDNYDINLASAIAFYTMVVLRQSRLQDEIKRLSSVKDQPEQQQSNVTTQLTLYTREQFDLQVLPALEKVGKPRECSVFIVDIDNFSDVDDNIGKEAAAALYKSVSRTIMSELGEKDVIGRHGKEGFVVLMDETDLKTARSKTESILSKVADLKLRYQSHVITTTVSIGLTIVSDPEEKLSALIRKAEMGLFISRENGGNTVKVSL